MNNDELLPSTNPITPRRSTKLNNQTSNEILKAYQVNAYKYINKKYENRGKVGLALLGTKNTNNYNILLYGKGNSHITQANINSEFEITSSEELYVSFYDVNSENWSLRFDSLEFFHDFINRMCVYKMLSSNKSDMVIMDIKPGVGAKVQEADLCEIELVIHSIKACDIASIIYSSDNHEVMRTQVGSNKLLYAVEKGLIGMSKGGYRVIAVPYKCPFNKGGSITIPNETNILVHIKLVRSKSKVDKPAPKTDINDSEMTLPDLNFDKIGDKDLDTTDSSKRSDLLSRMASLGRPIPAFIAETTNESNMKSYDYSQPNPIQSYEMNSLNQMMPNLISYNNLYDNMINKQLLPIHSVHPPISSANQVFPQVQQAPITNDFSVLFTETRQNNTEMRVALSKLQDKIDKISDKIDQKSSNSNQILTRHMDAENVFENIKRIINENESLKLECTQKSEMIDKQNRRINEVLKNNQLYLEESHDVIKRNSVSINNSAMENQNRILSLEEEKLNLLRNLSQKTSEVSQLELKLEQALTSSQSYRSKSLEYNDQINKLTEEIGDLKLKNRSIVTELNEIKAQQNSDSLIQEELNNCRKHWQTEEIALQNKIDTLKNNVVQSNIKVSKIQSDCDLEINEIRQQHQQEIEEWKNKLKLERQRISNKNSDLITEIEVVNQGWEQKFEDYQQTESLKSTRLTEKNRQLMVDNANFNREIMELKQQLSVSGDINSSEVNDLIVKNQNLSDQLLVMQKKIDETNELKTTIKNLEKEIVHLKIEIQESNHNNDTKCELLQNKNEYLENQLRILQIESGKNDNLSRQYSNSTNVEDKVKKIMNDVFKQIKDDINVEMNYSGKEVVNKCLIIIRDITMANIAAPSQPDNDSTEEEGDTETDDNLQSEEEESESNEIEITNKNTETVDNDNENIIEEVKLDELESNIVEVTNQQTETLHNNIKNIIEELKLDELESNEVEVTSNQTEKVGNNIENIIEELNIDKSESIKVEVTNEQKETAKSDNIENVINELKLNKSIIKSSEGNNLSHESVDKFDQELQSISDECDQESMSVEHNKIVQNSELKDDKLIYNSVQYEENENDVFALQTDVIQRVSSELTHVGCEDLDTSESLSEKQDDYIHVSQKLDISIPPDIPQTIFDNKKESENNTKIDNSKKIDLFSSDDDEEVLEFFEKLNNKSKNSETVAKVKPTQRISDIDDELSWLNN